MKSKKLRSLPIYSLEEGQQIGFVAGLVISPEEAAVAALVVNKGGWFKEQKIIPFARVAWIGDEAITIDNSNRAEKPTNLPQIVNLMKNKTTLIGSRVVAENGKILGTVEEYEIQPQTGKIRTIEITGSIVETLFKGKGTLDAAEIRTIGKDVVIVRSSFADKLVQNEHGLQDTMKSVRDTTGQFWESTVSKSKELTKNIGKSLEKVISDPKKNRQTKSANPGDASAQDPVECADAVEEAPPIGGELIPENNAPAENENPDPDHSSTPPPAAPTV